MKRKVALLGGKKEKFLGNSPKRVKKSENHQPDDWKEKGKEAGGDEMNMSKGKPSPSAYGPNCLSTVHSNFLKSNEEGHPGLPCSMSSSSYCCNYSIM